MRALTRGLASSFASAITSQAEARINYPLALKQHAEYVAALRRLLPDGVTELPADDAHPGALGQGQTDRCTLMQLALLAAGQPLDSRPLRPPAVASPPNSDRRCLLNIRLADCVFIEDTAVVVGRTAIIARPGAASRQGEEGPVAAALAGLGYSIVRLQPPAALDGGDVLQLPGSPTILVGLTKRTNAEGVAQLAAAVPDRSVHGVPVPGDTLHLKSLVTALDKGTLLLAETDAGRSVSKALAALPLAGTWQHVLVPDPVCANVLLLGERRVVTQASDAATEALLDGLCAARGLQLHRLPRATEMIKADGALTCCSILLPS